MKHKVDKTKTNRYYVDQNRIFHYCFFCGEDVYSRFREVLDRPANAYDINTMITFAWTTLAAKIRRHDAGTDIFWNIPFPQSYSRYCIELYLQCPHLMDTIVSGRLDLRAAFFAAKMKGIWL